MGGPGIVDGQTIKEFDNFTVTPFVMDDKKWLSSEQAYQSYKFEGSKWAEDIRQETNISKIYLMGQCRQHKMVKNFNRREVMKRCIRHKLNNNPHILKILLSTKGEILFPESDPYWGTNGSEGGQNVLGKIYAELKEEFKCT